MSHWIIYCIFLYLAYKFVRGFSISRNSHMTNTMNGKMRDIQNKMNEMNQQQQAQQQQQQERKARKVEGEYIDYEEVQLIKKSFSTI
jgi:hypothetical protein